MEWVDAARRFGNKLWNAVRLGLRHIEPGSVPAEGGYPDNPGPEGRWVLSRLAEVVDRFDELMAEYRFSDAFGLLYNFSWSEVFDWYLEMAKTPLREPDRKEATAQTMGVVLRDLLKLFHPAIPFLTEELWSHLVGGGFVAASQWPDPPHYQAPPSFAAFQDLVVAIRRFRAEHELPFDKPLEVLITDRDGIIEPWWQEQLAALAGASSRFGEAPDDAAGHAWLVAGSLQAFMPFEGLVDVEAERSRLTKAISDVEEALGRSRHKLDNADFLARAPQAVVARERDKAAEFAGKLDQLQAQLAELG